MSSPAQVAANLANSKLSTGPTSPEGKAASSQNHFKLGLACRTFQVRKHEIQEDFDQYTQDLTADYQPANTIERTLVLKMAQHPGAASAPSPLRSSASASAMNSA